MPLELGTVIAGKYELLDILGEGGMGVVYRAQDHSTGRIVALKGVRPDLVNERFVRKLTLEAKLMAQLEHPGIVRLYAREMHEGQPVLVMELVDAVKLEDMLKHGPLSLQDVVEVSIQILEALEYAHNKGVLHQDLSPSNVLLGPGSGTPTGPRYRVKLLDFGIAGVLSPPSDAPQTGIPWFNHDFASPEQRRGERLDARSDLYFLSLLMWRMLVKAPEIPVSDLERDAGLRHPSRRNANIPPWLDALVAQGLEPDRERRPPSALAMLERMVPPPEPPESPIVTQPPGGPGQEPSRPVIPPAPAPGVPPGDEDGKVRKTTVDGVPEVPDIPPTPRPPAWPRWVAGGTAATSLMLMGVLIWSAKIDTPPAQITVSPTAPPILTAIVTLTPSPTPPSSRTAAPAASPSPRAAQPKARPTPSPPPGDATPTPTPVPPVTPRPETTPTPMMMTTPAVLTVQLYRENVPEDHKVSVGDVLHTGDQVFFRVSATGEGKLWLFQCRSDGQLSAWDPARVKVSTHLAGIPLRKDRSQEVPDNAAFKLDSVVGTESFTFIFLDGRSPQARNDVESLTQKMLETKRCGADGNGVALRGSELVSSHRGQKRWKTDEEGVLVQTVRYRHE